MIKKDVEIVVEWNKFYYEFMGFLFYIVFESCDCKVLDL